MDPRQPKAEDSATPEDAPGYVILSVDERRQLTTILASLPLILTGGAAGRLAFLQNSGLRGLAERLPLDTPAESFAAVFVALAESATEPLLDPAGFHPLGAVCSTVLRQADAPRGDRLFLAGLILKYELIESKEYAAALHDEFGPPAEVTPWWAARRPLPPRGLRYYTRPAPGLDPLPFTLRTNVRNFLGYYLGRPDHPIPFGGRQADLARLEAWRTTSDKRCLLLATPGGRGKSALLVRWADELSQPQHNASVAVVFVPISGRFGTNRPELVYPCIAVQLAQLLGEEIPTDWANLPPGSWQNVTGQYLPRTLPDGRQLLLILDGLDEAAWEIGPDLLPHDLPPTTRVVVSARFLAGDAPGFGPWLGRLGWDRLDLADAWSLETLDREGVREALAGMGRPLDEMAIDGGLIERLYTLTNGDPLLVELYINWLFDRRDAATQLRPEELGGIAPGYRGFFDHWWRAQEALWRGTGNGDPLARRAVRALLAILATALGPLRATDILDLLPPETEPSRITLRRALEPLSRFVIGDGEATGYAFTHPRLGDYFREELLSERERRDWQRAFVDWAKAAVAVRRSVGENPIPTYLLQYAARHLALAGEPPQTYLDLLLTREWLIDWHRQSGTYAGFLRDVDAVLAQVVAADRAAIDRGEPAPYLGYEIQCVLCHASVNALSANMPAELLVALRRFGGWTDEQVLAYARQKRDAGTRAIALIAIAPWLGGDKQLETYQEALESTGAGVSEWQRTQILSSMAPYLPEEIYGAAKALTDDGRANVLLALSEHLLGTKRELVLQEALQAANTLMDEARKAELLAVLAPRLPEEQRETVLLEALSAVSAISDEWRRVKVLITLLPELPETIYMATGPLVNEDWLDLVVLAFSPNLEEAKREEALREALRATRLLEDEVQRARALRALAPYIPKDVYESVEALTDEGHRGRVLIALIPFLTTADREKVLHAAGALMDERLRTRVLSTLAPYLPETVFNRLEVLADEMLRAEVLITLVPNLTEPSKGRAIQMVLQTTGVLADKGQQAQVLSAFSKYLPEEVYEAIGMFEGQWWRAEVLSALAPYLPEIVYEATGSLADEGRRARVLIALAPYLPETVYEAVKALTDDWRRAEILIKLVSYLPGPVYDTIGTLGSEGRRTQVLIAVAPHLWEGDKRRDILLEALQKAKRLTDDLWWELVLRSLAPYLPETILKETAVLADEGRQAEVLNVLAPHIPEAVYEASASFTDEMWRARVLISVAPYLTDMDQRALLDEALRITRTLKASWPRARVMRALAPYLPNEVYEMTRTLASEWQCAQVLIALAPYLPETIYEAAKGLSDPVEQVRIWSALDGYLSAMSLSKLYPLWGTMTAALKRIERPQTLQAVAGLSSVIRTLGGEAALVDTLQAVETVCAWWP